MSGYSIHNYPFCTVWNFFVIQDESDWTVAGSSSILADKQYRTTNLIFTSCIDGTRVAESARFCFVVVKSLFHSSLSSYGFTFFTLR